MSRTLQILLRWLAALLMMLIIFLASSQPASNLPNFAWADTLVKKGGHAIGYALLAVSYWRGLRFRRERWLLAWLMAVLYAITDEFHQSFVPGRFASLVDVVVFDSFGALISLLLVGFYKRQRSGPAAAIVEQIETTAG